MNAGFVMPVGVYYKFYSFFRNSLAVVASVATTEVRQIFRISTVRYAEGL